MANTRWQVSTGGRVDFAAGSVVVYTCEDGFKFIGGGSTRSFVCQNNGSWHTRFQSCTRE